jgi:hypothetical protein
VRLLRLADGSPRFPEIDHHRSSSVLRQREGLPVKRLNSEVGGDAGVRPRLPPPLPGPNACRCSTARDQEGHGHRDENARTRSCHSSIVPKSWAPPLSIRGLLQKRKELGAVMRSTVATRFQMVSSGTLTRTRPANSLPSEVGPASVSTVIGPSIGATSFTLTVAPGRTPILSR